MELGVTAIIHLRVNLLIGATASAIAAGPLFFAVQRPAFSETSRQSEPVALEENGRIPHLRIFTNFRNFIVNGFS
jgi:hypothetical protein